MLQRAMSNVLIAGAGLTGAVTASILKQELPSMCRITIWEKARGPGGRMSTSRSPKDTSCTVDLGAQYISATPTDYTDHLHFYEELQSAKILSPLTRIIEDEGDRYPAGTKHFIPPSGSGSIVKYFIEKAGANVKTQHHINSINNRDGKLVVGTECGTSEAFDAVVLTQPVPQILQLGGDINSIIASQTDIKERMEGVEFSCRFAVGLFYDPGTNINIPWAGKYFMKDPIIRFVAMDNQKRGIADPAVGPSVLVHTSVPFALDHMDEDKDVVCSQHVLPRLRDILPQLPSPVAVKHHKWLYSQVFKGYADSPGAVVINRDPLLVCGGDAFTKSGFDGCLDSAIKIARTVTDTHKL